VGLVLREHKVAKKRRERYWNCIALASSLIREEAAKPVSRRLELIAPDSEHRPGHVEIGALHILNSLLIDGIIVLWSATPLLHERLASMKGMFNIFIVGVSFRGSSMKL
jgi:hypothetical protein